MQPHLPLLVFDLDGVLVDSEPISDRVFNACLVADGFAVDAAFSHRYFLGRSLRDCLDTLQEHFGRVPSEAVVNGYLEQVAATLRAELQPVAGVPEALALLPHPKCVASGSELPRIELSLEVTGLRPHFTQITSSYEVERGKPAPDVFLKAAAKMGYPPSRCIVVEDSTFGVQAGVAAGMQVLCYQPVAASAYAVPAGVTVFDNMAQLPALVAQFA